MKFIMVLVLMLSATFGNFVNADNLSQFLPREHAKVADYLSQNFELFIEKYAESSKEEASASTEEDSDSTNPEILNQPNINDEFNATSIEYRTEVILTKGGTATYLDFNDNNGYMLIEDDYVLPKFLTTGDLDWIRGVNTLYHDELDGFMIELEGELVPGQSYFDMLSAQESGEDTALEDAQAGYYGQYGSGYTKLFGPGNYFGDRYGNSLYDFKLDNRTLLNNFNGFFVQDQLAVYRFPNGDVEGNCAPTAMFNILYYYKHIRGYSSLNDSFTTYYAAQDPFYTSALLTGCRINKSMALPKLYTDVRLAATFAGYNQYGISIANTPSFIKKIGDRIPYNISQSSPTVPSLNFITNSIKAQKPLMMIYGDWHNYKSLHAVAVFGVSSYTRTYKKWIFTVKETRNAIMMSEGQPRAIPEQNVVYMDWEGYMSSCGNPTMKLYSISLS